MTSTTEQTQTTEAADDLDAELDDLEPDGADDDGAEPEWTPPTREEWEASQAKLKRANEQAKRLREKARTQPAAAQAQPDAAATAAGSAEVEKWQTRAVRQAAKAELLARGADPDMVDLALGRLRAGEIEFSRDDEPELEDWLEEMEDRFPKLFARSAPAASPAPPRPGRLEQGAAAGSRPVMRQPMSLGEQILARSEAARRAPRRG